jgi:hypothetical protein
LTRYGEYRKHTPETAHAPEDVNQQPWDLKAADDPVAVFTFLLVVIAGGQVCLFWWQLNLIRDGADDAAKAARAAEASAAAAILNAQAALGVELPRLELQGTEFTLGPRPIWEKLRFGWFIISFRNHGRTTAHITEVCVLPIIGDTLRPTPQYPKGSALPVQIGAIAPAGGDYHVSCNSRFTFDERRAIEIGQRQKILWVYGFVGYRNFLDEHWRFKFCLLFQADPVNPGFVSPGTYPEYEGNERYDPNSIAER